MGGEKVNGTAAVAVEVGGALESFIACGRCAGALTALRAEIDRVRDVNERLAEELVRLRGKVAQKEVAGG